MKWRKHLSAICLAALGLTVQAQTDTLTFSYSIPAVDVIDVSGNVSIALVTPAAGDVFASGSDSGTTLAFTSNNESSRNITVELDSNMPQGTRLELTPTGGTRTTDNLGFTGGHLPTFSGTVTLSTTATRLAGSTGGTGGFMEVAVTGVALEYVLTASLDAAPQTTAASRTVTFTIIAN
jgi:hypothetical protein